MDAWNLWVITLPNTRLGAKFPRHCEERRDEAIHSVPDRFAALAKD